MIIKIMTILLGLYYIYKVCFIKTDFHVINPLKPKLIKILVKDSVPMAEKTQHFSIAKIRWFMLFEEIITIYSEIHMKPINILCGQIAELLKVKIGGTYSYHWVLKG
jgi:hypothetical protein